MTEITGKDRRALRALGHHLDPVVQIGHHGITDTLVDAAGQALLDHELIKVKVLESSPAGRKEAAAELAQRTGAELAQVLGRTFLLYRENPENPRIALPGRPRRPAPAPAPAPRAAKAAPAPRPARKPPRTGTGARLPPRRHGR